MVDIYKMAEILIKFPNKIDLGDGYYYIVGKRRIYTFCKMHLISSIQYYEENNTKYVSRLYVMHFMYSCTEKVFRIMNLQLTDKTKLIGEKTEIWKHDYEYEI